MVSPLATKAETGEMVPKLHDINGWNRTAPTPPLAENETSVPPCENPTSGITAATS
tara:strand:- start:382 stop:549 length:168 start_codon:yes stop_codon:yes gene_type:complete